MALVVNFLKDTYKKRSLLKPLLWENTLKLPMEDVYTRLRILSRRKTDFQLGRDEVGMYDIFVAPDDVTVLAEGSPGIGKTTFCLKIAYDWANGKIPKDHSFPEFKIVLLLKCRDIDGDVLEAINEQLLPENEKIRKELIGYIKDFHYHGKVLLILDGLDELPEKFKCNVDELLSKKILPFCYVLATSRQERGIEVRQKVDFDVLLQIEGFTDADAFEYIRKHFNHLGREHLSKGERLINAIQENSYLHALPNNPLNLLLLCVVFEDFEGELPSRRTELYHIIIRCLLRRFCGKHGWEVPREEKALEKQFEESLLVLGELAWTCLLEDRHSFREGELERFERRYKYLVARKLGLVFKEASLKRINPQHEYFFFHKTFQEYLAAAYLAFLLLKKEVNIFQEFQLEFNGHVVVKYRQVFLFLSGILGEEASVLFRQIGKKLESEDWDWLKCSEEQASFFTESLSESENAEEVAMALCSFIPFPLTVELSRLGYNGFIEVAKYCRNFSQLQHPVHLSVYCDGDGEDFEVNSAFDYLKSCPKLQSLFVFTYESLQALRNAFYDGISQNSTLMSVTLSTFQSLPCDIADIVGDSLAASNTLTSVTFELFSEWGEAWARALEKGLSADTPLKSVVLKIHGLLSYNAVKALKRVLVNTSLISVVINIFGELQDSLAAALCEGLSEQPVLKSFTLVVFGRLGESGIVFLERGFLQNYSLNALGIKIFGELSDSWATVVNRIISGKKAKQSYTFHPNIGENISPIKVACLCPVLASFNLELALNVWGELSCEAIEALGKLLVKSSLGGLTLNVYGKVTDDAVSSFTRCLKIETCVHFVTFNIRGELTTNGKAAIEQFSSSNHNANVNLIVHDLISDFSSDGLYFCIDEPSELLSVFNEVKDTGTSELSLTISGVSDDWAQGLNDGLTNSTSLTTLAFTIENHPGENVGWMQRLLEVVLKNTSLATLALTLTLYSLTDKGIDLSDSLATNASITALTLTINNHVSDWCFLLRDGLASSKSINNYGYRGDLMLGLGRGLTSNKSLTTLTLTINNYPVTGTKLILDLGHGLASNKSLHTLTLTINNYSVGGVCIQGLVPGLESIWRQDLDHGLASNKSLHTLTLTINNYTGTGSLILGLGDVLQSYNSIHTLTVTINNFGETDKARILWLPDSLARNKSLTTANLTFNNYSNTAGDWMKNLGDSFARSESLTTLSLTINSCSEVSEDQLLELCNNLAKSDTLTTLKLTINDHSSTSRGLGCDLSKCFADCKSLTSLSLTVSLYGEEDVKVNLPNQIQ